MLLAKLTDLNFQNALLGRCSGSPFCIGIYEFLMRCDRKRPGVTANDLQNKIISEEVNERGEDPRSKGPKVAA